MITRDRRVPRNIRHLRLRQRVRGSAVRPRLAVFRSTNHIYAQLVDDDAAKAVGELLAQKAKAQGVEQVVFDRGGFRFHGRVKALADAARAGGLVF
jgi:large subunit ribosomal protein L18